MQDNTQKHLGGALQGLVVAASGHNSAESVIEGLGVMHLEHAEAPHAIVVALRADVAHHALKTLLVRRTDG